MLKLSHSWKNKWTIFGTTAWCTANNTPAGSKWGAGNTRNNGTNKLDVVVVASALDDM